MLSHCSQGKENSRPNMVRSLSVPLAPQQHDIPHFVLSAPAIPDGQTSLNSLSSPSSLSHQAFALSFPRTFYPPSLDLSSVITSSRKPSPLPRPGQILIYSMFPWDYVLLQCCRCSFACFMCFDVIIDLFFICTSSHWAPLVP